MESLTPSAMINKLLPIISSDSTIATYVNDHFGSRVTAQRIGELRELRHKKPKPAPVDPGPPIAPETRREEKAAVESNLKFLRALRKAYPKGVPV